MRSGSCGLYFGGLIGPHFLPGYNRSQERARKANKKTYDVSIKLHSDTLDEFRWILRGSSRAGTVDDLPKKTGR